MPHVYVVAPVEVQVSVVHVFASSHVTAAPAVQIPDWQESFDVHPFVSALHDVPFVLFDHAVWLVVEVHCWHALPGFAVPVV